MENISAQPVLVIKGDGSLAIFNVCVFTGIWLYVAYDLRMELFDLKHFNPASWATIGFLLLTAVTVLLWLMLLRNVPRLKIDAAGIWKQKNFLSRSLRLIVPWENVSYYTTEVIPSRDLPTQNLVVRLKDPDEPVQIGITDSDKTRGEILGILKVYSEQYGFNNFVDELNIVPNAD